MERLSIYELARLYRKVKGELCNLDPDIYRLDILQFEDKLFDKFRFIKERLEKEGFSFFIRKLEECPCKCIYYPHSFKSTEPKGIKLITNSRKFQLNKIKKGKLSVRKIFYVPIEVHIFTAFWIEKIGIIIDNSLPKKEIYGGRLKKDLQFDACNGILDSRKINKAYPGIFIPYYYKYSEWRESALKTISKFNKEHDILILTLDISNFYPSINLDHCKYLVSNLIKAEVGKEEVKELMEINNNFFQLIRKWNEQSNSKGLPIGLLPSPILANLYMKEFDEFIIKEVKPLFYGRYIDDIILILKSDFYRIEELENVENILENILKFRKEKERKKEKGKEEEKKKYYYVFTDRSTGTGEVKIEINPEKQKNFLLSKDASPSIVRAIQREINELSSLRKLMPDFLDTNSKLLDKVFQIYSEGEFGDNFRKVDQVRVRKLGMSILLSKLRELSRYLLPTEWNQERYTLYSEISSLIFDPHNFFDNIKNIFQLVQIMAWVGDYKQLVCLIQDIEQILKHLTNIEIKGDEENSKQEFVEEIKNGLKGSIIKLLIESILVALNDPSNLTKLLKLSSNSEVLVRLQEKSDEFEKYIKLIKKHNLEMREQIFQFLLDLNQINEIKKFLFKIIEEEKLFSDTEGKRSQTKDQTFEKLFAKVINVLEILDSQRTYDTSELEKITRLLLFPSVRIPYIYLYSLMDSNSLENFNIKHINAILLLSKGVFITELPVSIKPIIDKNKNPYQKGSDLIKIRVHLKKKQRNIRIGITNFILDEMDIQRRLRKQSNKTKEKYRKLMRIINSALNYKDHIDYIIFPELALPKDWIVYCSQNLYHRKISMITGGEYEFNSKEVTNPVYSLLYAETAYTNSYILLKEEKIHFAPEEKVNIENFRYYFKKATSTKFLYQHGDFQFANLICFDIADLKLRALLRGKIDALFVVSFNRDLEYFNSVVESAARDLHCYITIVNTGKYGDSRIRGPYRENYRRDIARIKGGKNSYLVIGEIDVKDLRKFHSQLYYDKNSNFKPHPPRFHEDIDPDRKTWNWNI